MFPEPKEAKNSDAEANIIENLAIMSRTDHDIPEKINRDEPQK